MALFKHYSAMATYYFFFGEPLKVFQGGFGDDALQEVHI